MTWRRAVPYVGATALIAYAVLAGTAPLFLGPAALSLLFLTLYYVCLAGAWNFFPAFPAISISASSCSSGSACTPR